jgi:hypothetical protein
VILHVQTCFEPRLGAAAAVKETPGTSKRSASALRMIVKF